MWSLRAPPSLPRFGYRRVTNETVVWISMGLWFTKNTNLWGKKNYPYSEGHFLTSFMVFINTVCYRISVASTTTFQTKVLPLSVLLWLHFYPPSVKVILFLIRSKDDMQVRVDNYDKMLKALAKGEKMVQKEIATVYCNTPKRKLQIGLS